MASPITWAQGLAGTGIDTATVSPVIVSANVIWLDFANGLDANAGTMPEKPVKTFAQAVTNASSGSIIAVVAGNVEVVTGTVAINKSIKVVGFGIGSARAAFVPASPLTLMFNITSDDVSFESIDFRGSTGAGAGVTGVVATANKGTEFYSCQFESGLGDGTCINFNAGADYWRIDGCSFTQTGIPQNNSTPINCAAATTGGKIFDTVVDGGTFGYASGNAIVVSTCTRLYIKNLTLVGRADLFGSTTVSYQIVGVTTSGASRIQLT